MAHGQADMALRRQVQHDISLEPRGTMSPNHTRETTRTETGEGWTSLQMVETCYVLECEIDQREGFSFLDIRVRSGAERHLTKH